MTNRFKIEIKKHNKATSYNVRDKNNEYNIYTTLNENYATHYCNYMNNYDNAKKFIICKDGNDVYWIFVKDKSDVSNKTKLHSIRTDDDICYIKQKQILHYNKLYKLCSGCDSLKIAEELRECLYTADKEHINSHNFTIIN